MQAIDTFEFEHGGAWFRASIFADEHMGSPWEEHDGHGYVSDWRQRNYMGYVPTDPGERVLYTDRHGAGLVYDWQSTMNVAKRDGWMSAKDAKAFDSYAAACAAIGKGNVAARAVECDFNRMRRFCEGDWHWIGVEVCPLCPECGEPIEDQSASLWGIESDAGDYLEEVAVELAGECVT